MGKGGRFSVVFCFGLVFNILREKKMFIEQKIGRKLLYWSFQALSLPYYILPPAGKIITLDCLCVISSSYSDHDTEENK